MKLDWFGLKLLGSQFWLWLDNLGSRVWVAAFYIPMLGPPFQSLDTWSRHPVVLVQWRKSVSALL